MSLHIMGMVTEMVL